MFVRSIRFRITLWYMLILGLTLSIFSISVYHNFSNNLNENNDDLVQSKAEGIEKSIDTYWEAEKLDAISEGARTSVFSKINNINFMKITQHWVEEKSGDPKLMNILVQIYNINGKLIASSKSALNIVSLPSKVFNSVSKGESRFDNFNIKTAEGKILSFRVFTMPVTENGRIAYIVQVASPLAQIYSALDSLKVTLLLFLPLTVFITGVAGAFLVKLTLDPVNSMIKTIRQITAENLKLRVNIPDTKDEVRKLADTFNDMLVKLDEAFSSERQFIQDVSHELKTPLTILKGELEVTLKRVRSAGEYESTLHSSLEEINRISKIVDNLLILARFSSKDVPFKFQPIDLNQIISNSISDIGILAKQKHIKIDFLGQDELIITADENYLKRLFLNLLDNAIKYTPLNGKITLNLTKTRGYAQITISDTGIGMSEDQLPHIFNRFYRVDKSREEYGFGLGLAIVKSIVEAHNGIINVKSKPGFGTSFIILLPLSDA